MYPAVLAWVNPLEYLKDLPRHPNLPKLKWIKSALECSWDELMER
jgi:hypothetical protein